MFAGRNSWESAARRLPDRNSAPGISVYDPDRDHELFCTTPAFLQPKHFKALFARQAVFLYQENPLATDSSECSGDETDIALERLRLQVLACRSLAENADADHRGQLLRLAGEIEDYVADYRLRAGGAPRCS